MEPIISKLQEGVKYPRFERDATKTINDLVDHITKERGIYSSSIEPNPSEHSTWFNTDTNTLMIYNNGAWRNFSGDSSGKTKIIVNPEKEELKNNSMRYTISDSAFYIIADAYRNTIEIKNDNDYDFWLYIERMPSTIKFINSNVITNLSDIYNRYSDWDYFIMLAHKIGNVVEFNVIVNDGNQYKYFTTKKYVYEIYVNGDGNLSNVKTTVNSDSISDIGFAIIHKTFPSQSSEFPYDKSIFIEDAKIQLLYPPYHYPLDANRTLSEITLIHQPKCLVINDLGDENYHNPFSINNNDIDYITNEDYMESYINPDRKYPTIPNTIVFNANIKFINNDDEYSIIRFPIRQDNKHNLIIKKPITFASMPCDQSIRISDNNYFGNLIIEDFDATPDDKVKYRFDGLAFGVKNVYLMGGKLPYIVNNIFNEEIKIGNSLIYGSNYNSNTFTFENNGIGINYVVIACKLNKDHEYNIQGNTLEDNSIIFTLQENIDILKKHGINPINGFKIITVNTVKDNDEFIVSESYGLTDYGINDFTRFEVPLVSY